MYSIFFHISWSFRILTIMALHDFLCFFSRFLACVSLMFFLPLPRRIVAATSVLLIKRITERNCLFLLRSMKWRWHLKDCTERNISYNSSMCLTRGHIRFRFQSCLSIQVTSSESSLLYNLPYSRGEKR